MRIGVIGGGVVGKATAKAFVEHVDEVKVHDLDRRRGTHSCDEALLCDLVFICLPTPQREASLECDTSVVEDFLAGLRSRPAVAARGTTGLNLVLRSTVPIGFTWRMRDRHHLSNLVHSPEFLTARCAVTDAMLPTRNIVGIPEQPDGSWDGAAGNLLCSLYDKRFPGVPVLRMYSDESEAVKLFQNGFFATKVAYFNEVRCLADKLGLNWDRVLAAVLADGRISHNHTQVPGPDGKFGFGPDVPGTNTPAPGACLPKDLANLIDCIQKAGLFPYVCKATHERNPTDRARRAVE